MDDNNGLNKIQKFLRKQEKNIATSFYCPVEQPLYFSASILCFLSWYSRWILHAVWQRRTLPLVYLIPSHDIASTILSTLLLGVILCFLFFLLDFLSVDKYPDIYSILKMKLSWPYFYLPILPI